MKVVAFVGPSGTGKSHRAIGIAHKNNCDAIIDDGLLIKGTKILAGTSAKNETNRIQAVKRAIFTEEDHAEAVRQALAGNDVRRLLILATSDNMIEKIVNRLYSADCVQAGDQKGETGPAARRQAYCSGTDCRVEAAFYRLFC